MLCRAPFGQSPYTFGTVTRLVNHFDSMTRRQAIRSLLGATGVVSAFVGKRAEAAQPRNSHEAPRRVLEPFVIDFPQEALDDLHRRIDEMRWPEMPFGTGWAAGTNDSVLRELADYWRHDYDWFRIQTDLNELTHLRGPIGGDRLHCVVYEPPEQRTAEAPFPLLLLHGWPGSFHEFGAAAQRLAAGIDGEDGFNVVVPSLPGFGFSDPPSTPGIGPDRIAQRLHALMLELGHTRYGVQGGDWGAIIGTQMARMYPEAIAGLHLNFVSAAPPPPDGVDPTPEEISYREARARFQGNETGYSRIQATRPQTLAYAQLDSPVGWLAWMLEKYWAWAEHGEDLWETFSREDILTTAMLYWLPARILSASRLYFETSNAPPGSRVGGRVEVPTGYARFPSEPWGPPPEVVERTYNLVHYSQPSRGGHFPALEQPVIWSREVSRFFSGLRA